MSVQPVLVRRGRLRTSLRIRTLHNVRPDLRDVRRMPDTEEWLLVVGIPTSAAAGVPEDEYEIHLGYVALTELTGRIHRRGLPTVNRPSGAKTDSEEGC